MPKRTIDPKNVPLNIRVTKAQKDILQTYAISKGYTVTQFIVKSCFDSMLQDITK